MEANDIFLEAMKNFVPHKKEGKKARLIKQDIVIDLHNKTLANAKEIIQYNIERIKKEKIKLILITGKGKHSYTVKPVLKEEIKFFLKEMNIKFKEKEEGIIEIW